MFAYVFNQFSLSDMFEMMLTKLCNYRLISLTRVYSKILERVLVQATGIYRVGQKVRPQTHGHNSVQS